MSGTGDIHTTVNLVNGGTATFTVTGTVPSGTVGALDNAATVTPPTGTTDPDPINNTATVDNPANVTADLALTKTASPNPYVPGQTLTYTVTVKNNGPSDVTGALVADPLPAALQGAGFIWTCATSGAGNACGATSGTGAITTTVNLANGGTATFTITGTVPSGAAGTLTNTATITPPPGVNDPDPTNNTASTNTASGPVADVSVIKSSSPNPYVPGQPLTYTIVVTNLGPSNAAGIKVDDPLPASLSGFGWVCAIAAPNTCGATSGTGSIHTTVDLAAGASATYTISGTVPSGTTGSLGNTATVTPPPGTTDPNPTNNTATNNNPANATADLALTKTSSPNPYVPGQTLTYTVTVKKRPERRHRRAGRRSPTRWPPGGGLRLDVRGQWGGQRLWRDEWHGRHRHDRQPRQWRHRDLHDHRHRAAWHDGDADEYSDGDATHRRQ